MAVLANATQNLTTASELKPQVPVVQQGNGKECSLFVELPPIQGSQCPVNNASLGRPPKIRGSRRPSSAQPASRSTRIVPHSAPERSHEPSTRTDANVEGQSTARRACSLPPLRGRRQEGDLDRANSIDSAQRSNSRPRAQARGNGQQVVKGENSVATLAQGANKSALSQPCKDQVVAPSTKVSKGQHDSRARSDSANARPSRKPPLAASISGTNSGQSEKRAANESAPSKPARKPPLAAPVSGTAAPQKLASSFQAELAEWKRRRGLSADTHVFSITGAFPGIRNALLEQGWVENDDRTSSLWEFKYALWQRDIGELGDLDDSQVINYFARNSELVSKVGLCNNLYSCCTLDQVDVDSFFPRCYDLTNPAQVDNFIENFKATTCFCLLRCFVTDGGRSAEGGAGSNGFPITAVRTALEVCRRRCVPIDDCLDESPRPLVSDAEWQVLERVSIKKPGRVLKPWGRKAAQAAPQLAAPVVASVESVEAKDDGQLSEASDAEDDGDGQRPVKSVPARSNEDEELYSAAAHVLGVLRPQLPQGGIDGYQNIWILKPAGKSRGRGIQLSSPCQKLED